MKPIKRFYGISFFFQNLSSCRDIRRNLQTFLIGRKIDPKNEPAFSFPRPGRSDLKKKTKKWKNKEHRKLHIFQIMHTYRTPPTLPYPLPPKGNEFRTAHSFALALQLCFSSSRYLRTKSPHLAGRPTHESSTTNNYFKLASVWPYFRLVTGTWKINSWFFNSWIPDYFHVISYRWEEECIFQHITQNVSVGT